MDALTPISDRISDIQIEESNGNFLADIHYFISVPEDRPLHAIFEKSQRIRIDPPTETREARITFSSHRSISVTGDLSLIRPEYNEAQESLVRLELEYGEDRGASLEWDWMIQAPTIRNEGMQNYRPFCLDVYFYTKSGALQFLQTNERYRAQNEKRQAEKHQETVKPDEIGSHDGDDDHLGEIHNETNTKTPGVKDIAIKSIRTILDDEEELLNVNILSLDCFEAGLEPLDAAQGAGLQCTVVSHQPSRSIRLLVLYESDAGTLFLRYNLSNRSFAYQLPNDTIQIRHLRVDKQVQIVDKTNQYFSEIQSTTCTDCPIFKFQRPGMAQSFQEILRKEKLVYNGVVQWLRSSSESIENVGSSPHSDPTNFTCIDDRKLQIWETTEGFVRLVFHRQFHLVSTYITPSVKVDQEHDTSIVKLTELKIRFTEGLPEQENLEAILQKGTPVVLRLKFPSSEGADLFVQALQRCRQITSNLFPESEQSKGSVSFPGISLPLNKSSLSSQAPTTPYRIPPPPPPPPGPPPLSIMTSIQASLSNTQPFIIPSSPQSTLPRRTPTLPRLYQVPSQYLVQTSLPSPRPFSNPQSPLATSFQPQPLSPFNPAAMQSVPTSIYRTPSSHLTMNLLPSRSPPPSSNTPKLASPLLTTSGVSASSPPLPPSTSPNPGYIATFGHHGRNNSITREPSSFIAELPADVPSSPSVEREHFFPESTGLGGNVPISSAGRHQGSMSKMFKRRK